MQRLGRVSTRRRPCILTVQEVERRIVPAITVNLSPDIVALSLQDGTLVDSHESHDNSASLSTTQTYGKAVLTASATGAAQISDSGFQLTGQSAFTKDISGTGFIAPQLYSAAGVTYMGTFVLDTVSIVTLTGYSTRGPNPNPGNSSTGSHGYLAPSGSDSIFSFDTQNTNLSPVTMTLAAGTYYFNVVAGANSQVPGTGLYSEEHNAWSAGFFFSVQAQPVKAQTTTTLTATPSTVTLGQAVTLNATVASATAGLPLPTGYIIFSDGAGLSKKVSLSNGVASVKVTGLTLGDHEITATYSGDTHNNNSASSPVKVAVNPYTYVTLAQLETLYPTLQKRDAERYIGPLNAALQEFKINTPVRISAFLAEIAAESGELTSWSEAGSDAYLSSYDHSLSLGNTLTGDGKLFRGRGPIMVTGRYNYTYAGPELGYDLISNPGLLSDTSNPIPGFRAAAWYWTRLVTVDRDNGNKVSVKNNTFNKIADSVQLNDVNSLNFTIDQITMKVMGQGNKNYPKQKPIRETYYKKALSLFVH